MAKALSLKLFLQYACAKVFNMNTERYFMKSQVHFLLAFTVLLLAVSPSCSIGTLPTAVTIPTQKSIFPAGTPQQVNTPSPVSGSSDIINFVDKNNLLAFDPPRGWIYQNESKPREYYKDTFTSPDGNSKIESIVYNDGTPFDPLENGKFALYLLNTFYSATGKGGDIRISSGDGTQRLEWTSNSGGYSGVSSFELRGDGHLNFLMFTAKWANGTDQATLDAINTSIASYRIP
jgi:hypothetical protein